MHTFASKKSTNKWAVKAQEDPPAQFVNFVPTTSYNLYHTCGILPFIVFCLEVVYFGDTNLICSMSDIHQVVRDWRFSPNLCTLETFSTLICVFLLFYKMKKKNLEEWKLGKMPAKFVCFHVCGLCVSLYFLTTLCLQLVISCHRKTKAEFNFLSFFCFFPWTSHPLLSHK